MSEEGRRVSTTPIPVPVPFYAQQAMAQPTQTPLAAPPVPPAAAAAAAAAAATIENPTTTATENNMTTVSSAPKDVTMTDAEPSSAAVSGNISSPAQPVPPTAFAIPQARDYTYSVRALSFSDLLSL